MIAVEKKEMQANPEKYFDMAAAGESVSIPWTQNQNIVVIPESEFQSLRKAKHNLEYWAMLDESDRQFREGRVIRKTMAELEAMADE